jgi:flavin reductase (DIM6/NTAB) family NADH-FMN oxidoreductase RutF
MKKKIVPTRPFWYSDVFVFPKLITILTTKDKDGNINAAPYSFIMQYDVMNQTPRLILGFRNSSDTFKNIEATGEFVINCPSYSHLDAVMETARFYPAGENELDHTNMTLIDSQKVSVPSIKECKQIIECTVDQCYNLDKNQGQVIANIEALVFDEDVADASRAERIQLLDLPVGLGDHKRRYYHYATTRDAVMHELEEPPEGGKAPRNQPGAYAFTLKWEPKAQAELEKVPGPILDLVITSTEDDARDNGLDIVTHARFLELADDFAPKEIQDHFRDGEDVLVDWAAKFEGARFVERAHAMFNRAINSSPAQMREFTSEQFSKDLRERSGGKAITEKMLIASITHVTPEPFQPNVMSALKEFLEPSAAE